MKPTKKSKSNARKNAVKQTTKHSRVAHGGMGPKKVGANKGVWRRRSWAAPQSCGCPRARTAIEGAKFPAARARWGQQQQVHRL